MDIGSEYIKTAESTILGEPKMRFSPNGGNFRAAGTVRKPKVVEEYNSSTNIEKAELRFGTAALKTLKHHPEFGFEYIPRAIGRTNTSFHTSTVFSAQEMMALYLQDYAKQFTTIPEIVMAVPAYWTTQMRYELSSICKSAEIPLVNIIDDKTAVASHYAAINYRKFQNQSRNVMFVDAGATSMKVYGFIFGSNGQYSYANETIYIWTEKGGSYHFAKNIAEAKQLSMKKAMKYFQEKKPNMYIRNVTDPSREVIRAVADAFESFSALLQSENIPNNSGEVDEIQVFGGAAKIELIAKAIKKAANQTKLYYEFNQNEAIAKGIIYRRSMAEGTASVPPCIVNSIQTTDLLVATDNQSYYYCQRAGGCRSPVVVTNKTNTLRVIVPGDQVPEGASLVQFYCELENLTNFSIPEELQDQAQGEIYLRSPMPEIAGIRWCVNGTCQPIAATKYPIPILDKPKQLNFTLAALDANRNKRLFMIEFSHVEELISKIKTKIDQKLEAKHLTYEDIPSDLMITFNKYLKMLEDGTLMEKSIEGLCDAQTDLKINSKHLLNAVSKLKSKKKAHKTDSDDIFNDLKNDVEDNKEL
jgi:hypothetical protein